MDERSSELSRYGDTGKICFLPRFVPNVPMGSLREIPPGGEGPLIKDLLVLDIRIILLNGNCRISGWGCFSHGELILPFLLYSVVLISGLKPVSSDER